MILDRHEVIQYYPPNFKSEIMAQKYLSITNQSNALKIPK